MSLPAGHTWTFALDCTKCADAILKWVRLKTQAVWDAIIQRTSSKIMNVYGM